MTDSVVVVSRQRHEPSGVRNLTGETDLVLLRNVRTGSESYPAYFPICSGVLAGGYSGWGLKLILTSTLCNGVTLLGCGPVSFVVLFHTFLFELNNPEIEGTREI